MLALKCSLLNRECVLINALKSLVSIVFTCSLHVIFLSNIMPRYFTLFTKGMFCKKRLRRSNSIYQPLKSKSKSHYDRRSVGQFVLVSWPFWNSWPDVTFIWVTITFFIFNAGSPLWREDGSVICSAMTQILFQVTLWTTVCRPVRVGAGPPMGPITRF
jgi:hypothetical protein